MAMTQQKRLDLARRTGVHPLVYSLLLRAKGLDILQDGEWVDEYTKTQHPRIPLQLDETSAGYDFLAPTIDDVHVVLVLHDVYYPIPGNHLNHKSPFDWS
ncbi:hypothetical protein [Providencia phage PSTNGR1]|uniref:Uncharacterized protein n=1 Tax=Providencia phage PSTNGR1 TaxID=2783542 RepID=A0A873WJ71_9CAUD|nr:hypothetical protein [Providencia phage PSTNGR1]